MINTKNWFQLRPMYSYIRKQAENKKFLKYLEIGGTFTLVAIFLFFAIMPTMTAIFSLIGEIKSKEAFIKKADLKITNVIKAQTNYSQIQEKYYLIEDSFPSLAQYYKGTSNLATIFKESSLDINQISLNLIEDKNKDKQFFKTYQLIVNGEGQYSSIMEMVKKIFNNRRLVNTNNIQLNQLNSENNNQTGSQKIKVNFSSDLYFLPNNEEK
jgi:Pilus assembly protein, PilO